MIISCSINKSKNKYSLNNPTKQSNQGNINFTKPQTLDFKGFLKNFIQDKQHYWLRTKVSGVRIFSRTLKGLEVASPFFVQ